MAIGAPYWPDWAIGMTGQAVSAGAGVCRPSSACGAAPPHAVVVVLRDGRLPVGAALPPSRALAADLGVSRWTVTEAYGQLITEGYLAGKTGSSTRVTWSPRPGDQAGAGPARRSVGDRV
jgi:hypothetical protein